MITPVLLCGGSGTRLWPTSRKSYPKQFAQAFGEHTLFQKTALRFHGQGYESPIIVTHADYRFVVAEQLLDIGIEAQAILVEPEGRDTAPAILAAALSVATKEPDKLLVFAPTGHVIHDDNALRTAIDVSLERAKAGDIVTFGVTPTRADSNFGYLVLEKSGATGPVPLESFVEKPDGKAAKALVSGDNVLWNSGMLLMTAQCAIKAIEQHAPSIVTTVKTALKEASNDFGFVRLDAIAWSKVENISIDTALMKTAKNIHAVAFGGGWADMADWDEVRTELDPDANGVSTSGTAIAINCKDTLLRSEDDRMEIVGVGLTDIIAVATSDAVLVSHRGQGEEVKKAVALLTRKGIQQAQVFPVDHRPWGWFESLVIGDRFQVKRIMVKQGAALSLQSHHHRSEHWIIVEGTARVTLGETEKLLGENESIYIPLGAVHRIANTGKVPVVMIEVQTGAYLGEDDILRYEDVYARD
jgi:mannose-1-phosphate guanylyltransferase/mannose-6-phosphate isomerase